MVGGTVSSVVTIRAVLGLDVTPQITPDGRVILDVDVTKDSIAGFQDGSPIVPYARVSTKVIVNNGDTAVLGGIYEEAITDSTDKVPVLDDLPAVGNLFKRTNRGTDKRELLIFRRRRTITDLTGTVN